jgi:hypothetical protein
MSSFYLVSIGVTDFGETNQVFESGLCAFLVKLASGWISHLIRVGPIEMFLNGLD